MDALAQLALMTKAKLVFESSDTFLSFPALSPVSYAPDRWAFLPTVHDMSVFSEFSQLTNALPQGALFQPSLDNTLWNVYLNVLRSAQLAQGTLSDEQNARLQEAQALLQTQGPDGLPVPSAAALAYGAYQQAYIRATQRYKAQQLTAEASSDTGVQAQWQNVDEPALRAQVDAAESDWETKGFKAQVEQARQIVQQSAAESPALQWQSWKSQCNPDIDFLTDTSNQTFGPTVFLPYDAPGQSNWPSFTMTGAEIQQLASQAPPELANAVGTATPNSTIDSVSFEFCSVALGRPWFHPEVFAAQFWKFSDSSVQLSDGGVPPHGQWPAYITALIFARNIAVTSHTVGGGVQTQPLAYFPQIMLRAATVDAQPAASKPVLQPVMFAAQPAFAAPMIAARPIAARPVAVMAVKPPAAAIVKPAPVAAIAVHPVVMTRLNAAAFTMQPAAATPSSQPSSSPGAAAASAPASQPSPATGQVSILAFVCKRLPKCPNPDPNLQWG